MLDLEQLGKVVLRMHANFWTRVPWPCIHMVYAHSNTFGTRFDN
jgi:hypothetical protein